MRNAAMLSVCAVLWLPPWSLSAAAQVYWDYKTAYMAYDRGDFRLAADMYERLAAGGDVRSQNDLAFLYSVGQGVPQDNAMAAKWYRLAAESGYAPAQRSLANLYVTGRGVTRDDVEAHKWLNLASIVDRNANHRYAASARRDEIGTRLTPAQLATARKRACVWLTTTNERRDMPWGGSMPRYCATMGAVPSRLSPPG